MGAHSKARRSWAEEQRDVVLVIIALCTGLFMCVFFGEVADRSEVDRLVREAVVLRSIVGCRAVDDIFELNGDSPANVYDANVVPFYRDFLSVEGFTVCAR